MLLHVVSQPSRYFREKELSCVCVWVCVCVCLEGVYSTVFLVRITVLTWILWRPLIKFQLISPRTCRQPCVTPTSHRLSQSRMTHPPSHSSLFYYLISLLLYCEHKSELWGGTYPPNIYTNNNEPCHYQCFNWLCWRNALDRSQNNSFTQSSSHTRVISLLYFGSSMERPHSSLLEWQPVFPSPSYKGKMVCSHFAPWFYLMLISHIFQDDCSGPCIT